MDIYLDATPSLYLLRASLRGADFTFVPATDTRPIWPAGTHISLERLDAPELLSYLNVSEEDPLEVLVASGRERIRAHGISCRVSSRPRGATQFMELVSAYPEHETLLAPDNGRILALTPEGIVLSMAGMLRKKERNGELTRLAAQITLLKLCLELCGAYALDPKDPHTGSVTYKVKPPLTTKRLAAYLSEQGNEPGLSLARSVLPHVFDKSGSPLESFAGTTFFGDPKIGGFALRKIEEGKVEVNETLKLSKAQKAMVNYRTITPDFTLSGHNAVVEILGEVHKEGDNPRIDHVRQLDYATLGILMLCFTYADIKDQHVCTRSAARIADVLAERDPEVRERFERLKKNRRFCQTQRMLIGVFRPKAQGLA